MIEVRVIFLLLNYLNLLSMILRIGVAEEGSIGSLTKPVRTSFKLIVEIFVVVFGWTFADEIFSIGALAAKREVATSVTISRFNILVVSSVAWELAGVGAECSTRSFAME